MAIWEGFFVVIIITKGKLSTFQPLHSVNVPVKIRFKSGGTKLSW